MCTILVRCPTIGQSWSMGIATDQKHFDALRTRVALRAPGGRCPLCGEQHVWSAEDLSLSGSECNGPETAPSLDGQSENVLYMLLGEAWLRQFKPDPGRGYYIGPTIELGKREFGALLPVLRMALRHPSGLGFVADVDRIIKLFGAWQMPPSLVAVLAVRNGLAPVDAQIAAVPAVESESDHHDHEGTGHVGCGVSPWERVQ